MKTFPQLVRKWLRGNEAAVAFVLSLHEVVETWDDMIDKDEHVSPERMSRAFHLALVDIPRNGFYQDHFALLSPIVEAAIFDWYAANEFERRQNFEIAWGLANAGLCVTVMCARILGGPEWAKEVNVEFRELTESLSEFVLERTNGVD